MSTVLVDDTYLTAIADAIRTKSGVTTTTFKPSEMAAAIEAIPQTAPEEPTTPSYAVITYHEGSGRESVALPTNGYYALICMAQPDYGTEATETASIEFQSDITQIEHKVITHKQPQDNNWTSKLKYWIFSANADSVVTFRDTAPSSYVFWTVIKLAPLFKSVVYAETRKDNPLDVSLTLPKGTYFVNAMRTGSFDREVTYNGTSVFDSNQGAMANGLITITQDNTVLSGRVYGGGSYGAAHFICIQVE